MKPVDSELIVHKVSKSFGHKKVLEDLTLRMGEHEVIGLLGRNGAGKTTLLRIMAGIIVPDSGTVELGKIKAGSRDYSQRVTYLSERNALYPGMYVEEYLIWVARLYRVEQAPERVDSIIHDVGLADVRHQVIGTLSKGFCQRVGLAAAIVPDPEILLLDEPINGLDPVQIVHYHQVIKRLSKTKKIILSSHLMEEIRTLSDRIILIDEGQIKMDAGVSDIKRGSHRQLVHIAFDKPVRKDFLSACTFIEQCTQKDDRSLEVLSADMEDIRERLFDYVVANGLKILSMYEIDDPFSDLFESASP